MIPKVLAAVVAPLLFVVGVLVTPVFAHGNPVPAYDGLVNDYGEVLSEEFEAGLETELMQFSQQVSGAEIAVVTVKSLDGDTVEHVAQDYFDSWKIGKREVDNGVLLLVAPNDRKLRIATGYGTEALITDAEAGRIIRDDITPSFASNNFEQGIRNGVSVIRQQLSDAEFSDINPINKDPGFMHNFIKTILSAVFGTLFVVLFSYWAGWLGRTKEWWPGGLVGAVLGGLIGGIAAGVFFGLFGLLLDYILSKNYKNWKQHKKPTDWKSTWGGFSSGSSSSSSSGSSFSFGGGSSGGGGASGSW